jgi:ABC-2 type transport system ATP-binding protein
VPAVEVVRLRKEFTRRRRPPIVTLDDVSLTIARGECVAVLGQNGSGKSTLVRLLSTLLLVDGGRASVFGHDVAREEGAVRSLVNRVSVEASFFKRMSATENLSYAARFYGIGPRRTRQRIPEILGRLLCTHDMDEAEALADRVGILDAGGCSRSSRQRH